MDNGTTNENSLVLAMYDVRGIQKYIYRTEKVRDAVGASYIIENIIENALVFAVKSAIKELFINEADCELNWKKEDDSQTIPEFIFDENKAVQVLFIGGGNATVKYKNRDIAIKVNKKMSKYVLEQTYSLQLAVAMIDIKKVDGQYNYASDYKKLNEEMFRVKANMNDTKPLGALPVQKIELKTGFPAIVLKDEEQNKIINRNDAYSKETLLKEISNMDKRKEDGIEKSLKKFDTYITKKGTDSQLAVVHIDGNNMGLRIRELIQNKDQYNDAVNTMRNISYNIDNAYKSAFEEMRKVYNRDNNFILKILTAGDDITYVANAGIALESVAYFASIVSGKTMNGKTDEDSLKKYGFSVCAGVAFMHSHFPFSVGYSVAESCCDSAKEKAKLTVNKDGGVEDGKVGNWVDYQVCKNIQTQNLELIREREYITSAGEQLLIRPYELPLLKSNNSRKREEALDTYESLKKNILYFQDEKNIPRSHVKTLRNLYSEGKSAVHEFKSFLESRNFKMPDGHTKMYDDNGTALWYDAVELIDYFSVVDNKNEGDEGHE